MPLGDIENLVLSTTQQPGAGYSSADNNGYPNWGALNQAQYGQAEIDNAINIGYRRACIDLQYIRSSTASFGIFTQAGTYSYNIPPPQATNPYPPMIEALDIIYAPMGLINVERYEPGSRLIGWDQFQRMCGQSYARATTQALWPAYMCVRDRKTLEIFPAPAQAGDSITVTYSCAPTANANAVPTLVNQTDTIILPEDAEIAIAYFACSILFPKMSDFASAREYRQMYAEEIQRLKVAYARQSSGDALVIEGIPTGVSWSDF